MSDRVFSELLYGEGTHADPTACIEDLAPASEEPWSETKLNFSVLLRRLADLAQSPPESLTREVKATHPGHAKVASSLQPVLWQTLVHNSYHAGQIAMMRRCLRAWPPRAGGDSW